MTNLTKAQRIALQQTDMDIKFRNVLDMLALTPPETVGEVEYLISAIKAIKEEVS